MQSSMSAVPEVTDGTFLLTLVGSGVSTGVPVMGHFSGSCACADALRHPDGPNRRNNVSLLITLPPRPGTGNNNNNKNTDENNNNDHDPNDHGAQHILIDCGKTFRDAYFRVLASHRIRYLDALLLTHDHMDATGGLDDLRDLQRVHSVGDEWFVETYIPTYTSCVTLKKLQEQVGYILRNSRRLGPAPRDAAEHEARMQSVAGQNKNIGHYRSAALDVFEVPDNAPVLFYIAALGAEVPIYAVPVEHGPNYTALGFVFGRGVAFRSAGATAESVCGHSCVVYLSDVSAVPACTMAFLQDLVKIDVLFVDVLYGPGKRHVTHYCMDDAVRLVEVLQPVRTFGIGMYCDVEHNAGNAYLMERLKEMRSEGRCGDAVQSVELGYDGLNFLLPL